MLGLQAYEDDLCACGWPSTYTTHEQSRGHWSATTPRTCQACAAREREEERMNKSKAPHHGLKVGARPDSSMVHAMSDPILNYETEHDYTTGASGDHYLPGTDGRG